MTLLKNILMCFVAFNISTISFGMDRRQEKSNSMLSFLVNVAITGVSAYCLSKFLPQALTEPSPINVGVTSVATTGIYYSVPAAYGQGKTIVEFNNRWLDEKIKSTGYVVAGLGKIGAGIIVGNPLCAYENVAHGHFDSFTLKNSAKLIIGARLITSGIKDFQRAYDILD